MTPILGCCWQPASGCGSGCCLAIELLENNYIILYYPYAMTSFYSRFSITPGGGWGDSPPPLGDQCSFPSKHSLYDKIYW